MCRFIVRTALIIFLTYFGVIQGLHQIDNSSKQTVFKSWETNKLEANYEQDTNLDKMNMLGLLLSSLFSANDLPIVLPTLFHDVINLKQDALLAYLLHLGRYPPA